MKLHPTLILPALLVAVSPAFAQTTNTQTTPRTNPRPLANEIPVGNKLIRYQQWYAASEFTGQIRQPMRIVGIDFRAFSGTGPASTLDMEVSMANASSLGIQGNFATNLGSNPTVVLPRTSVSMAAANPGNYTLSINFTRDFVWDGQSAILVEIRKWGHSQTGSFFYGMEATFSSPGRIQRVYSTQGPTAKTGTWENGKGLHTRFRWQDGGSYDYGSGCAGPKGIVPVASSNKIPVTGDQTFAQRVDKVTPGNPAVLVVGFSRTQWGSFTLPWEMKLFGWNNCYLQTDVVFLRGATTKGVGVGAGNAVIPTAIPAIGNLGGLFIYSQWIIADPASANGQVSASQGLWHVIQS